MKNDYSDYLRFSPVIDGDHPHVASFAHQVADPVSSIREKAVRLYYAVRDTIRYDPYNVDLRVSGLRASQTLAAGRGWCVPKAILMCACARVVGIPAGLGYADVKNHLSTERLRTTMNTDVFFWHGYTTLLIDGKWIKATPTFNIELCERFGLKTLEFDGKNDSLLQPFDLSGHTHMEYLRFRGEFSDAPLDLIRGTYDRRYPQIGALEKANFDKDCLSENSPLAGKSQES